MNLVAYSDDGLALFARNCKDREKAKREVLFNPWTFRVDHVVYKGKRYTMKEVMAW